MAGMDVAILRIPKDPPPPPPSPHSTPNSLPSDVVQAVAIGNLKAISEQPAMVSNLAFSNQILSNNLSQQNAIANQQAMNELRLGVTAKAISNVADLGPLEARSAVDVLTNDELAQTLADLKATVQAMRTPSGGA